MATAIWPLEKKPKNDRREAPRSFSHFFARFCSFGLTVSDLFWQSVVGLFALFACCHLAVAIQTPLTRTLGRPSNAMYGILKFGQLSWTLVVVVACVPLVVAVVCVCVCVDVVCVGVVCVCVCARTPFLLVSRSHIVGH